MNVEFDVDFAQAARLGEGFIAELGKLRELDPVHWSPASRCWIVTRHADVEDGLAQKLPLSNKRLELVGMNAVAPQDRARLLPTMMRYLPHWIIDLDAPDHTRLRRLLVKAFSRKVVDNVRPFARERVAQLIAKIERHPTLEFNEDIARQLPGSVMLNLLGLPQELLGQLRGWANAFAVGVGVPFATVEHLQAVDRAMADMNAILMPAIDARRREPREDLITSMIQAVEDGESMTLDEMLGALHILIVAGHDSTSNTLSFALTTLARRPEIWDYLYRNPDRALPVALELMRHGAMATSQPRIAAADFLWHGKSIRRGDIVFLMLAAANRDAQAFADPERFDPQRNNDRSMVFGPGVHHCIGHLLAKMQVTEFLVALTQRFAGVELLDEALQFMPQVVFRGYHQLNVRLRAR